MILIQDKDGEKKKFSGSAFEIELGGKHMNQRILHHGTLLFNTDLQAMQNLLNPNVLKMKSKGVDSVRARVINLNNLEPELKQNDLAMHIGARFLEHYAPQHQINASNLDFNLPLEHLGEDRFHNLIQKHYFSLDDADYQDVLMFNDNLDREGIGSQGIPLSLPGKTLEKSLGYAVNISPELFKSSPVNRIVSRMADRNWVLGRTPNFSNNIEFKNQDGFFDIYFDSEKGLITQFKVFSDALFPNLVESLNSFFAECLVQYGKDGIFEAREKFLLKSNLTPVEDEVAERFFNDLSENFE